MEAEQTERTDEELADPIARAFMAHVRGSSYRQIAAEHGVSVSTAYSWVQKAVAALEFRVGDPAAERARDRAALDDLIAQVRAAMDTGEVELVAGAKAIVPLFSRKHALLGLDLPRRIAVQDDRSDPKPAPNMALFAALRDAVDEHEQRTAEIEAGMDGALDGAVAT